MPARIASRRSFSAAITSRAPLTGSGSAKSAARRRNTGCTPDLIRKSSMSERLDSSRPSVTDISSIAPRSSREATIPASSSTGTVSEATSAVDTPRLPIPFSAASCRCAASLTKLSANDWWCSPDSSSSSDISVPTRDITSETIDRCMSSRVAPAGRENRNPVCSVPGRMTIRLFPG